MFVPDGSGRRRRAINLGGASRALGASADPAALLRRAQDDRERREEQRRVQRAAESVQTIVRKRLTRRHLREHLRASFDSTLRHVTQHSTNTQAIGDVLRLPVMLATSAVVHGTRSLDSNDTERVHVLLELLLNPIANNNNISKTWLDSILATDAQSNANQDDFPLIPCINALLELTIYAPLVQNGLAVHHTLLLQLKLVDRLTTAITTGTNNTSYQKVIECLGNSVPRATDGIRNVLIALIIANLEQSVDPSHINDVSTLAFGIIHNFLKIAKLSGNLDNTALHVFVNILTTPLIKTIAPYTMDVWSEKLMFSELIRVFSQGLKYNDSHPDSIYSLFVDKLLALNYPEPIAKELGLIHSRQCDPALYILTNVIVLSRKQLDNIDSPEIGTSAKSGGNSIRAAQEMDLKMKFMTSYVCVIRKMISDLQPWSLAALKSLASQNRGVFSDVIAAPKVASNETIFESDSDSNYSVSEDDTMDTDTRSTTTANDSSLFLRSVLPSQIKSSISNAIPMTREKKKAALLEKKRMHVLKYGPLGVRIKLHDEQVDALMSLFNVSQLKKLAAGVYLIGPKNSLRGLGDGINVMNFFIWLIYNVFPRGRDQIVTSILNAGGDRIFPLLWSVIESLTMTLKSKKFSLDKTSAKDANFIVNFRQLLSATSSQESHSFEFGLQTKQSESQMDIESDNGEASPVDVEQLWIVTVFFCILFDRFMLTIGDNEFFAGVPLNLQRITALVTYLKNIAFCLYSSGIGSGRRKNNQARSKLRRIQKKMHVRKGSISSKDIAMKSNDILIPDLMQDFDVRQVVTQALYQIHSRDSRRSFCPSGHWTVLTSISVDDYVQAFLDTIDEEPYNSHKPHDITLQTESEDDLSDVSDDETFSYGRNTVRSPRNQQTSIDSVRSNGDNNAMSFGDSGLSMDQGFLSLFGMPGMPSIPGLASPRQHVPQRHTVAEDKRQQFKRDILTNVPFLIPFEERARIFRGIINSDKESLGVSSPLSAIKATVHRDTIFKDGYLQLNHRKESLKNRVMVTFIDKFGNPEAGIDGGGVFKEFLTSLTKEAINTNNGLFSATVDNLLYPSASYYDKEEQLNMLQFLGRIIGKSMYEGILIDAGFAGFFLSKWLGRQSYIDDLPSLDGDLYKGLVYLKNTKDDVAEMSLTFSIDEVKFGVQQSVDLIPNGSKIPVTNDNKIRYVYLVANYKLNLQIAEQCSMFFSGLRDLIDPRWLRMFNQEELQALVGGTQQPIDVADLKANTVYAGEFSETHDTIRMFWEVLSHDFTQKDLSNLIKFSTGCGRPPLLGFGELSPKFCIRPSSTDQQRLPTASTCVNLLKLPAYNTKEGLKSKLHAAIDIDTGFEFS